MGTCGKQGWLDRLRALSLVRLNLTDGECVTGIDNLENDDGCGLGQYWI
ncbi:MAG TPA: hypothetical protein VGS41_17965 [Chthonomonadales bacterium]|nr:hypothetical protein [Chthonomonadales bacterium]